jgi:hypothetical protein
MHNELKYQVKTHTISEKLYKNKIKFKTTRIIVKCLIKSSNQHKRKPKPQDITFPEFEPLR